MDGACQSQVRQIKRIYEILPGVQMPLRSWKAHTKGVAFRCALEHMESIPLDSVPATRASLLSEALQAGS